MKLATNEAVKFAGKEGNFELNERFVIAKVPGDYDVMMLNYGESGYGAMIDVVKSGGSYITMDENIRRSQLGQCSNWTSAQTCVSQC